MPNELYHYGVGHDKGGHSGRYPYGSGKRPYQRVGGSRPIVLDSGSKIYRYSNREESGPLQGTYTFKTKNDTRQYFIDSRNARLGFREYDKVYMTEIVLNDKAVIRRGRDTVKDIVDKIGDAKVSDAYDALDKLGFWDDKKSMEDRWKLWENGTQEIKNARLLLGSSMNKHLYDNKNTSASRQETLDRYRKMGYDAIVDPEDFSYNYEMPLILLNEDKFKRTRTGVVSDESSKDFFKRRDEAEKNNEEFYDFTNEDKKRLEDFIKNRKKKG